MHKLPLRISGGIHISIAATLFGLAGCAQTVWVRPDYTPQLFAKDSYECERDVRQSGYYGTGISAAMAAQNFFDRCMIARGWTKQVRP